MVIIFQTFEIDSTCLRQWSGDLGTIFLEEFESTVTSINMALLTIGSPASICIIITYNNKDLVACKHMKEDGQAPPNFLRSDFPSNLQVRHAWPICNYLADATCRCVEVKSIA